MILIADSGSTKTEWAYISQNEKLLFRSAGMNPYFTSDKEVESIINIINEKLKGKTLEHIVFFGSGCNSTEKGNEIKDIFKNKFPGSDIEVHSDLVGAAVALFGNQPGIAVILGTGANSGYYDGKKIGFKTESLGYVLGDEGSGAHLGKEFVKSLLYHDFPSEIENDFIREYKMGKAEILDNVYKKTFPNRFLASFTVFMKKHEKHPAVRSVIKGSFDSLVFHHLQNYPQKYSNEFGFVGSIAWHFKDILTEVCEKNDLKVHNVICNPLENLIDHFALQKQRK